MTNILVSEADDLFDQNRFGDALKKYKFLLETAIEEGYDRDEILWCTIRHNYEKCIFHKEIDFIRGLVEKNSDVYDCSIMYAGMTYNAKSYQACYETCNRLMEQTKLSKEKCIETRLLRFHCFLKWSYIVKETHTNFFEDLNYLFVTLRNESNYKKLYKAFLIRYIPGVKK